MASSNPAATSLRINPPAPSQTEKLPGRKNPSPLALNGWININPREEGQCILALSPVEELQFAAFFDHRNAQDFRDVLARTYLAHSLGEAFATIAFAFSARLLRAPQLGLEFF